MNFPANHPALNWEGTVSLEETSEGVAPWRIPFRDQALFPEVDSRARGAAGVRITFSTDSSSIAGEYAAEHELRPIDLVVDGRFVGGFELNGKSRFEFGGLGSERKRIELWLPQMGAFTLKTIAIDDGSDLAPWAPEGKRWITYGSSITQCGTASSPTRTWPAQVARESGVRLTSLGFGGQCHLDPMVARLIRDLPADAISVCAGINIYGHSTLSSRSFAAALIGTVATIREGHPETPLLLISPIGSSPRETKPNAAGMSLRDYREKVRETADLFRDRGDANLHYLSGLELLTAEEESLLRPDLLHPNDEGYAVMAQRFLAKASPVLFCQGQ